MALLTFLPVLPSDPICFGVGMLAEDDGVRLDVPLGKDDIGVLLFARLLIISREKFCTLPSILVDGIP